MEIEKLIRAHLKGIQPYSSARSEYLGEGILLDANENSIGSVLDHGYNRYPDPLQKRLKSKIIPFLDNRLTIHQLFLGNGSDEIIDLLVRAFCEPGKDEIIVCPPVFAMFEKCAQINNVLTKKINLREDFQLDVERIRAEITDNTKIIFICSPNNPTGNLIHSEDIKIILNTFKGLVVIDEAYIDFSNSPSWVEQAERYPNLLVLRTFSKAWGLAALRLGLLVADQAIIEVLNTIKMPYNINVATMELILTALDKQPVKTKMVDDLNAERAMLYERLGWLAIVQKVYASEANFLLVKFEDSEGVFEYLMAHGLVVRNRSNLPHCKNCLRITVGNKEENKKLLKALNDYQETWNEMRKLSEDNTNG